MESKGFVFLAIVAAGVIIEAIYSHYQKKGWYDFKETMGNLGIMIGNNLLRPILLAWNLLIFNLLEPYQFFEIPVNALTIGITFLATEFAYYWYHRFSHEIPLMWTMHHTHHSSPWMNLSTAIRVNWIGKFMGPIIYTPLILIGLSPEIVIVCLTLGLFYQFFLHTEAIGKLSFLEGWINTPSAHRVHHGSNERYIDKNYGGLLMIYDRIFGTYEKETEKVRYGVTTGFLSHNPLKLIFSPLIDYLKGNLKREKSIANEMSKSEYE